MVTRCALRLSLACASVAVSLAGCAADDDLSDVTLDQEEVASQTSNHCFEGKVPLALKGLLAADVADAFLCLDDFGALGGIEVSLSVPQGAVTYRYGATIGNVVPKVEDGRSFLLFLSPADELDPARLYFEGANVFDAAKLELALTGGQGPNSNEAQALDPSDYALALDPRNFPAAGDSVFADDESFYTFKPYRCPQDKLTPAATKGGLPRCEL